MPKDSLKNFTVLRRNLETERERIVARLAAINAALESNGVASVPRALKPEKTKRVARAKNEISLKEAIVKVTTGKALTKEEIHEAVQKLGYKFTTKKPLASISVVLYGKKPKFKNADGKFTAAT